MAEFTAIKQRLVRAGVSPAASEWLLKALSPATPSGNGCLIPDSSAVPVATPEFVVSKTVSAPAAAAWDMMVITPPTYPLVALIITGPVGYDFTLPTWAGATIQVLQTEPVASALLAKQSVVKAGWGSAGTAPVVGGSFNETIPSTQPLRWRRAYSSLTAYLVAADLANQGTITSGQYAARTGVFNPGVAWGFPDTAVCNITAYASLEIPMTEEEMTAMNPKVRVAPAKQGVYQPMYNVGPIFQWASGADMPSVAFDSGWPAANITYSPYGPSTGTSYQGSNLPSFLVPMDVGVSKPCYTWFRGMQGLDTVYPYTWGYDNTMTGVSIWRGLDASASVTLKFVLGLEIMPSPLSPVRQFVLPAADYEPRALQLYFDLVHDMPHTYPASSNFLGAVLAAVGSLLPSVLPHIAGIVQSARGVFGDVPNSTAARFAGQEAQPEMRGSATSRMLRESRPVRVVATPRRASSIRSVRSRTSSRASSKSSKRHVTIKAKRRHRR